ncbi:MAG TPA: amidohydrolase family protein, partial [Stellaceae bacterium]|nr:amidohydrolase family protein [Stellaceae bacterium]
MTDCVLRGGEVIDGSGRARFRADVAIAGDRIAEIGKVARIAGAREIDVSGKIVAPGFIDVHTHDDRALFATPEMAAKASQGVTTVVTGNCGISLAPLALGREPPPPLDLIGDRADYRYGRFADYLAALDREPPAANAACLVGHSTLRVGAMTALDRPAEAGELARMRELLQEALDAGAVGLSTGLAYAPAEHAPPAEIEALAALLEPAGALYATHMRNEGDQVLASLDESFAVGRAAGVPVVISHHKTIGPANFGRTAETLPKIAAAIDEQEVGLDCYPYIASSTVLTAAQAGRASKVLVTWSKSVPEMAGRELALIAAEWGVPIAEAAARLQPAGAVYWMMDEPDVERVLGFPHTMIGSDGLPHDIHPHPRLWG